MHAIRPLTIILVLLAASACGGGGEQPAPDAGRQADAGPGDDPTPDAGEPCGPETCDGCCDGETCRPGGAVYACGLGGEACVTCDKGQTCADGACVTPEVCTPENCDGCCEGDTCHPGDGAAACGLGGGACRACEAGDVCSDGTCLFGVGGNCVLNAALCAPELVCVGDPYAKRAECREPCDGEICPEGQNCYRGMTVDWSEFVTGCTPEPAPDSEWRLVVDSAFVRTERPDGTPWDEDGYPDLVVEVCAAGRCARTPVWTEHALAGLAEWQAELEGVWTDAELAQSTVRLLDDDEGTEELVEQFEADLGTPWDGHPGVTSLDGDRTHWLRIWAWWVQ